MTKAALFAIHFSIAISVSPAQQKAIRLRKRIKVIKYLHKHVTRFQQ
jgi:hypothetical protein